MSNLSELLPAGGAAKEFEPVASGTLPNGRTVILKANGQVEVAGESDTPISANVPASSEYTFNAGHTTFSSVAFDPYNEGKFVICYTNNSNGYGHAIVGTVSGTSLSFGSAHTFHSGYTYENSIAFDPNTSGKFVIGYRDGGSSNAAQAVSGTLSGTSLSFGNPATIHTTGWNVSIAFDPNTAGKFAIAYTRGDEGQGDIRICSQSGAALTIGSSYDFVGTGHDPSIAFDPNQTNKILVGYGSGAYRASLIVATVSGTSVTYGTESALGLIELDIYGSRRNNISFDPNTSGSFVYALADASTSWRPTVVAGTLSVAVITVGTPLLISSSAAYSVYASFDPNTASKVTVVYGGSNAGYAWLGTVSSNSVSGSSSQINSGETSNVGLGYDQIAKGKFIASYTDESVNTKLGKTILGQSASSVTTTNVADFVGITAEAITSGATGVVVPQGGVATNLSSLTIGSNYYVQADGTVSTVSTSPAVNIGKAISATSLILKG